ncbi:protein of unknown function [Glycomyces sambucus]|uniref:DUF4190 domain-containing protein n=1 Tax=Glycomyces sambucus TaxID=380244 RepID=A0A1G9DD78_9ACTN|nr:DUF4190 domain-containing protein [Glycomyces sambucus]SDK61813.1 protein of unknown function [Glycomyces sambucus]
MSAPEPTSPEPQRYPPAPAPPPPYVVGPYPPPYGYYPPPRPVNGMAIAAMVLGIIGVCNPVGVLGLIFGMVARRRIAETGEAGDGFATTGIVLGWIGTASIVFWILYAVFWVSMFGAIVGEIEDWPTDDPSSWDYSVVLTLLGLA